MLVPDNNMNIFVALKPVDMRKSINGLVVEVIDSLACKPLPKNLPIEQIIHDIDDSEKVCPCGTNLHKIGEDTSEQLEWIPAQVKVIEHVRIKYGCRRCEEGVKMAPAPKLPIQKVLQHLVSYLKF